MYEIFIDVLIDSAKMIPLLFVVYAAIELIEYKFGNKIREKIQKAKKSGPTVGALTGVFPQCGFSVIATALYSQRLLTIGTLLAVYLATSDEAIPMILSRPDKIKILLPLILTKIVIAIIAGYVIDFFFKKTNQKIFTHVTAYVEGKDEVSHHHELPGAEHTCCGHSKINFLHPLIHTFKIFIFILIISFLIGVLIFQIGEENIKIFLQNNNFFQPIFSALIGIVPSCAASVAITELYFNGIINYGSLIAGLCAGGGLGVLILFKEEKNKKSILKVLVLLFVISVFAGLTIQYML
jgi:hypothetical protein